MGRHLTDEELIDLLYEIKSPESHVERCEGCKERWERLLAKRQAAIPPLEIPEELLIEQRRRIYERIERSAARIWSLRPAGAVAAVCVMLLAVFLSVPRPDQEETALALAAGDSQLFGEIYSMVESSEPPPIQPIYGLFEERQ
ncbi:MAG: hypothetical protein KIT09_27015 [Bryobacteraceae bacterium]|nr:hypothetical protein [Bryobacteraceae bacterium]